ncbi:MAG: hypothetical protein ACLUJG_13945 [Lawsonibacter sp.]
MKRNRLEKLGDFVLGKGFYIVLFLCVAAIGISGYYLIRSVSGSEPAQEPVTANPSVTLPDSSAVFPGEQSHQPQPTPEPAAPAGRSSTEEGRGDGCTGAAPGGGLHLAGEGAGAPGLHGGGPGL